MIQRGSHMLPVWLQTALGSALHSNKALTISVLLGLFRERPTATISGAAPQASMGGFGSHRSFNRADTVSKLPMPAIWIKGDKPISATGLWKSAPYRSSSSTCSALLQKAATGVPSQVEEFTSIPRSSKVLILGKKDYKSYWKKLIIELENLKCMHVHARLVLSKIISGDCRDSSAAISKFQSCA